MSLAVQTAFFGPDFVWDNVPNARLRKPPLRAPRVLSREELIVGGLCHCVLPDLAKRHLLRPIRALVIGAIQRARMIAQMLSGLTRSFEVLAIDSCPQVVANARGLRCSGLQFACLEFPFEIDLPNGAGAAYDLVLCGDFLSTLDGLPQALAIERVACVLRKGGVLALATTGNVAPPRGLHIYPKTFPTRLFFQRT